MPLPNLFYVRQRLELMREMYGNDAEVSPSSPDVTGLAPTAGCDTAGLCARMPLVHPTRLFPRMSLAASA